jgi:trimeric autotransporter adhesin
MQCSTLKCSLFLALLFSFTNNVFAQPANDACANAKVISVDTACVTGTSRYIGETLQGALNEVSITSACGIANARDVWYKFIARTKNPTITISNQGSGWGGIANVKIQLLSASGSCTGFAEVACATGATLTPTLLNPLIEGATYYIRIHKNVTTVIGTNHTFDICVTDPLTRAGRMNEIFARTVLSDPNVLQYPWEITYGPDDSLWVTEARGYKVYKINNTNGGKRVVLDLSSASTWFGTSGTGADTLYAQNTSTWINTYPAWPQGGFAGLALHPQFGLGAGKDFVYVTYVWKYISGNNPDGVIYRNKLVRFTYNNSTARLESPAVLDWNLPGSTDHNSQRLVIAPVTKGGTNYLFMGSGDMGAGQFTNRYRTNNSQNTASYEGKILRYNLESDGDAGYNAWLPNDNPYGATNAVWSVGVRNNQGFAYDTALNILYGTSHGPYSDDELNVIERAKNYGHPRVIGYAADGNYNGSNTSGAFTGVSAGTPYPDANVDNATSGGLWYVPAGYTPPLAYSSPYNGKSSLAPIGNEVTNATTIGASYKDPLFSAYPSTPAIILNTWQTAPGNGGWESEGWSGLDLYTNKIIPGWKKSLVAAGLKWGRLIKLNLNATGTKTLPSNIGGAVGNAGDTITYFQSSNRYRDLAFAPNGKDIFLVMDNSSATSGPGTANPTTPGCQGCVVKYSFLGYGDVAGLSTIPKSINVTDTTQSGCYAGTAVTIDGTNNFLWVPITGPDGNIMAEINAMGQNMGVVNTSFYKNTGAVRIKNAVPYLNRNITITPTITSYTIPVKVRLYISKAELTALSSAPGSAVSTIADVGIFKNNDPCSAALSAPTGASIIPTNTSTDLVHGSNAFVLQTAVTSFSSFYFAAKSVLLPVDQLTFSGVLQSNLAALLKWQTENEINTANFELERSTDGNNFKQIAVVKAAGNSSSIFEYAHTDNDAADQQSTILYYRLKIINTNGSFKYSNIINISLPTKASVTVVPNPVLNDVRGNILSPVNGNVALQTSMLVKKGNNNFVQNINSLASGAYYLAITGNGINSRTKFQKL